MRERLPNSANLRMATAMDLRLLLIVAMLELASFCHGTYVLNVDHKFAGRGRNLRAFKSHDEIRHRRFLSAVDIPLGGNGLPSSYGLYFANIGLGNPPKDYYVQVDTGSDILWVNCIGCTNCPKKSDFGVKLTLYDPASSSNSSNVHCNDDFCKSTYNGALSNCKAGGLCQYSVVYGDGSSTSGFFVEDMVQLRKVSGNFQTSTLNGTVVFGCGSHQAGELGSSSEALDGILGFGQANSSILSQLAAARKVKKVFSHCLDTEKGGGIFVIGESVAPQVKSTPIVPNQSHYNVELESIEVDGTPLDLPSDVFTTGDGRGTIIDSGTTLAYFPDIVYQTLLSMCVATQPTLSVHVVDDHFQCFSYPKNVDDGFPDVTFRFKGSVTLTARPHDYLFEIHSDVYCFGWQSGGSTSDGKQIVILGDLVLSNKLVVYDLEKQTIGWTNYNCSSSIEVKDDASSSTYLVNSHNLSSGSRPASGLGPFLLLAFVLWHALM